MRTPTDKRPGPMPEIRADGESVTFHLEIAGVQDGARLTLRCDPDGNVWATAIGAPARKSLTGRR